jgi:putative peptidoglycan lipid II flippase
VLLTMVLGVLFALPLPKLLGVAPRWGAAGLTASAGIAGWVEFLLLRRGIGARIGRSGIAVRFLAQLWGAALISALIAWGLKRTFSTTGPIVMAELTLIPFGIAYFVLTAAVGVEESRAMLARASRMLAGV